MLGLIFLLNPTLLTSWLIPVYVALRDVLYDPRNASTVNLAASVSIIPFRGRLGDPIVCGCR